MTSSVLRVRVRSLVPSGRRVMVASLVAAVLGVLALGIAVLATPLPEALRDRPRSSLRIVDRGGRLLAEVRTERGELSAPVALSELSPWVVPALLAAEDARFFEHPGADPVAMVRALGQLVREGRIVSGASTLTQQLARTVAPHPRTALGKLGEVVVALRIERSLDKRAVLEEYLARVEFGPTLRGIEAASRYYFDKPARALDLGEAAALVSIPRGPTLYDPRRGVERLERRRQRVLGRMLERGLADERAVELARATPFRLVRGERPLGAEHLVAAIAGGRLGVGAERRAALRTIETTLDAKLQRAVEEASERLRARMHDFGASASSVVVLDNVSGDVLAYVGAPDFHDDEALGQNDGVRALRQPGSTLKPFLYAVAMQELGATAATVLPDVRALAAKRKGLLFSEELRPPGARPRARARGAGKLAQRSRRGRRQSPRRRASARRAPRGRLRVAEAEAERLRGRPRARGRRGEAARARARVRDARARWHARARTRRARERRCDGKAQRSCGRSSGTRARRAHCGGRDGRAGRCGGTLLGVRPRQRARAGVPRRRENGHVEGLPRQLDARLYARGHGGRVGRKLRRFADGALFRRVRRGSALSRGDDRCDERATGRAARRPDWARRARGVQLERRFAERGLPPPAPELFAQGHEPRERCAMHESVAVDPENGLRAGPACESSELLAFERYPAEFLAWATDAARPLAPERFSPRCPGAAAPRDDAPSIAFPPDGARFRLDPGSGTQEIVFAAQAAGGASVRFLLDGRSVGSAAAPFRVAWALERGEHRLEALVGARRSEPVRFRVE